ncbi:MAG TPA: S8 family serine peptidase [Streptosporangiaceae bacterium]|nr:S8 family serine peptidase [Streptosporangiaceae bacterium]
MIRRALRKIPIVVPALLLAIPAAAEAGGSSPAAGARSGSDKVIVVLRSQFAGLPDTPGGAARRSAAVAASQRGVLDELAAAHARAVTSLSLVNAVAATVSPAAAARLAADPAVAEVVPDRRIPYGSPAPAAGTPDAARAIKPLPGACPTSKNAVQLDPEAIEVIHAATQSGQGASAQALGYTGAGVKVAYIADGIDTNNPDFIRANGRHVFIDKEDFSGTGKNAPTDGSEAFLDASSIAAQGRHVYNVSGYLAKLTVPCRIRILGVAPGASLVGLDTIGSAFTVFSSVLLEAIDYAVTKDHVDVINESFGLNKFPDIISTDLIELANDAAVRAGVTVTVSSGDSGVTNTIGSPASDPRVISVGATTTYRSYAQSGFADIVAPGVKGWIDNNISGLSSGGFTQTGKTVDVVAPGDLNWALCTPNPNLFFGCQNFNDRKSPIELEGGTSESAPLTAGVAALVIQAYEQSHHGHRPTPALVKRIIVSTAQDIDAPGEQQGAGMIDAYQAVLAARSYRAAPRQKAGHAVLESATQFNAVGRRSARESFTETLTNTGQSPVTVHLAGRTLSPYATVASKTLHVNLDLKPVRVRFHVAGGKARLNVSLAVNGGANISLIAPDGDLAEYNLSQGVSNLGNAQVADPEKGTWTAIITVLPSLVVNSNTVPAHFLVQTATWRSFGKLSARSLTLPEGASRSFSLTARTPSAPGDRSGAIVVRTAAGSPPRGGFRGVVPSGQHRADQTTIPVTLRALATTSTRFKGTLTGGNGRGSDNGQTAYYEINVRPGTPALNATITDRLRDPMSAELVSPTGLAESAADNLLVRTSPDGPPKVIRQPGVRLHVTRPGAGKWTLIIDFVNPVSGKATTTPFQVSIDDHATRATQTGLPTSARTKLPAGKPVTAELRITNNSPGSQQYFVDARRCGGIRGVVPRASTVVTSGSRSLRRRHRSCRYPTSTAACPSTWCQPKRPACRPR